MKQPEDIAAGEYFATTWEDTVMSKEQVNDIFCPINTKRKNMPKHQAKVTLNLPEQLPYLEAQAKITWEALLNKITEWGKGDCPHDIQELSQSGLCEYTKDMPEKKRECPLCWQAFLKEQGVE